MSDVCCLERIMMCLITRAYYERGPSGTSMLCRVRIILAPPSAQASTTADLRRACFAENIPAVPDDDAPAPRWPAGGASSR